MKFILLAAILAGCSKGQVKVSKDSDLLKWEDFGNGVVCYAVPARVDGISCVKIK